MAFDACMMRAVLHEISSEFADAKIEKVLQPTADEINLVLHAGRVSRRLVLNVGPNSPRLQLSDAVKENPINAPMFCMYLRKYIGGAKIEEVYQLGFDRIAVFRLSAYDELGFKTERKLICEIMGKYANIILLDKDDKVMNALKIVDFSASSIRQVMPGMKYQIPQAQQRLSPIEINRDEFLKKYESFPAEKSIEKFITATYSGVAMSIARELCFRASGEIDTPLCRCEREKLYSVILDWQKLLISHGYSPTVAYNDGNEPLDYSYMSITMFGTRAKISNFESLANLFDSYFAEKDRIEKIRHRAKDILLLVSGAISRTEKKLAIQKQDLQDSEKGEEYKRKGDLITANLYRLNKGMTSFKAIDYYAENCPEIEIFLDERLSPSQNAQRFYKLYSKSKNAKAVLTEQIKHWEGELRYLDTVNDFLSRAESEQELVEIREELHKSGYGSRMKNYRPQKSQKMKISQYKTTDGKTLLVGKNNLQNDYLTCKMADKNDIWFHVKDFPGSHVVLVTSGEEPSDLDYTESASLAAYFSKAKGENIAVDYTRIKNIKKPQGSKPGFVTYKTNYTAYVKPSLPGGKE